MFPEGTWLFQHRVGLFLFSVCLSSDSRDEDDMSRLLILVFDHRFQNQTGQCEDILFHLIFSKTVDAFKQIQASIFKQPLLLIFGFF